MSKMFDRAAVVMCLALAIAPSMASAADDRDFDRSSADRAAPARGIASAPPFERGRDRRSLRPGDAALSAPAAPRRKVRPNRFNTKVTPRPNCELGLHGCYVRNGDRRGVF